MYEPEKQQTLILFLPWGTGRLRPIRPCARRRENGSTCSVWRTWLTLKIKSFDTIGSSIPIFGLHFGRNGSTVAATPCRLTLIFAYEMAPAYQGLLCDACLDLHHTSHRSATHHVASRFRLAVLVRCDMSAASSSYP